MIDPNVVMQTLSQVRPVFHSEADFQHAFAWQVHLNLPECKIRLEYPLKPDESNHLDIAVLGDNETAVFELKYKTTHFFAPVNREVFFLKGHYAQDVGRYDFWKDVQRLEEYVSLNQNVTGYAILLTNDSSYWNPSNRDTTICDELRLTEGRNVTGTLNWGETAGKGTTRGRELLISLSGLYECIWQNYFEFDQSKYVQGGMKFRYIILKVLKTD